MEWREPGLVIAARRHGEGTSVVSLLTRTLGRHPGLHRESGRTRGGLLQPGTVVDARWRGRLADHLGTYRCEMMAPVAPAILSDPGRLAALTAACAILETALAELDAQPAVYDDALALLKELGAGDAWASSYVRWELALLRDLGYGLDLSRCAVSGARQGLAYVSPRTGRAVTAEGAGPWRGRLLPLPTFLVDDRPEANPAEIGQGLALTGFFLGRWVYGARHQPLPVARARLSARFTSTTVSP